MKNKFILPALVLMVVTLAACTTNKEESSLQSPAVVASSMPAQTNSTEMDAALKTYEGTERYDNPGGGDEVGFKLGVDSDGVVRDVQVEVKAEHATSVNRQIAFRAGIKDAVVGKPLTGLKVDRVGGSSLTSVAFNNWVATLQ